MSTAARDDGEESRLLDRLRQHTHDVLKWYVSLEDWDVTASRIKPISQFSNRWIPAEKLATLRSTEKILYELRVFLGFFQGQVDLGGRHFTRYELASTLWDTFHEDFSLVRPHTSTVITEILGPSGDVVKIAQPATNPPEIMSLFEEKWKVRRGDWSAIEEVHDEVAATVSGHPEPILQGRNLLSLPPELLHIMMSYVTVSEANQLGATCQALRQVSLPHIYRSRNITLKFRIDEAKVVKMERSEAQQHIREEAEVARTDFMEHLLFLLNCSTVSRTMEKLNIRCWSLHQLSRMKWDAPESMVAFLSPVLGGIYTIINHCYNLTELSLSNALLLESHVEAIVSLSRLEYLSIVSCKTLPETPLPATVSKLRHLSLILQEDMDMPSWRLLAVFPNLRWLEIGRDEDFQNLETPDGEWGSVNPFGTLERVSIIGLHLQEVDEIMTLIHTAAQNHVLKLTHFKVKTAYGLPEDMLLDLLSVLSSAPLEHLIIDGIQDAECDVLDRIAELFPRLRTLSLSYRDSTRQFRDGFARWPRCTWEYANHLARLVHLEHFGWNLDVPPETHLSGTMHYFEYGFPEDAYDDPDMPLRASSEKANIVRLFGSNCPALKSFAFFAGRIPAYHYWIDRDPEGRLSVRPETNLSSQLHHIESWPMFC